MAELDYSNTILIIKPVGPVASEVLQSKHNVNRLVSFHFADGVSSVSQHTSSSSRECTPFVPRPSQIELHLKFDSPPHDPTRGFIFGTNVGTSEEQGCDIVLLDSDKKQSISGKHFAIDFNWDSGFARLNNISRYGTGMTAPSVKDGHQFLTNNRVQTQMLHPREQTRVHVGNVDFDISFPDRGAHQLQYQRNWATFRAKCVPAVPNVGPLGIETRPEITEFQVRRESRKSGIVYYLHDEIGKGEFGSVCKATEVRTGAVFAAKQFTARKPGWDIRAYLEIAISEKISHKHIVNFVDFIDDGGGPVIVMEYMRFGNLAEFYKVQGISLEVMRTVLHQVLQALEYLHDRSITHRDIKPENILVASPTPQLLTKICDFGLSADNTVLKSLCGTKLYAAAEIFDARKEKANPMKTNSYSNAVDIWAIAVVSYCFMKGLPQYTKDLSPQVWSRKICHAVNLANFEGVDLLRRMLQLNPLDRPSAKECLSDPWIRSATALAQSEMESDARPELQISRDIPSEQPTVILDPLWQVSEGPDGPGLLAVPQESRKRLRSFEAASRAQIVQKVQRRIRAQVRLEDNMQSSPRMHEYDRNDDDSRDPHDVTRISCFGKDGNPHSESSADSLLKVQTIGGNDGKKLILKRVRSTLKHFPPANKRESKVLSFDTNHIYMSINNKVIMMRKEDCSLNATQIMALANKNATERKYILGLMKEKKSKVVVTPPTVAISYPSSWVDFQHGRVLCKHLGMEEELQPLVNYGLRFWSENGTNMADPVHDYLTEAIPRHKLSQFYEIPILSQHVSVRMCDFKINASHLVRISGRPKSEIIRIRNDYSKAIDTVLGFKHHQGTYVDFRVGLELCRKYDLVELEEKLHAIKRVSQEPAIEQKLSEFIEITEFSQCVMVRRSDFRINASHIVKLAGYTKTERAKVIQTLPQETYDRVQGSAKHQGTYVDFSIAIDLCQRCKLAALEKRLYQYRSASEVLASTTAPHYAETSTNPAFRQLPGLAESFPVPPPDRSAESTQPSNQDATQTSVTETIRDQPVQALDTKEAEAATNIHLLSWDSQPQCSVLSERYPNLEPQSWRTITPLPDTFGPIFPDEISTEGGGVKVRDL